MDEEDLYEDHARGHKITRKGYQAILKGVREKRYAVVYVYMLDRWGRDSIERQARGKEFDKLGAQVISVMEGIDEPGIVRPVRAELAEQASRNNALRVTPNRERAAREGTHMGTTPYGYRRHYPEWSGTGKRPSGLLVPDATEAKVVRWLFERYVEGTWTTRMLAEDLNRRGVLSPKSEPEQGKVYKWTTGVVRDILSNPVYVGLVGYNQRPTGHYLRAAEGSGFTAEGKHAALVERDVFAQVQRRLADARTSQAVARKRTQHTHVVAGFLRCADCGGLMVPMLPVAGSGNHGALRCANRHQGVSDKTPGRRGGPCSGYRLDLATEALVREASRLRGAPWTVEGEARLRGDAGDALASLDKQIAEAKADLKGLARNVMMRATLPTPEEQAVYDELSREQSARIAALEQQRAQIAAGADELPRLRALHRRFSQTEVGDLARRFQQVGDTVGLRDLLALVVESATLVERRPATRSTWLRFEPTWTPDVQKLLGAGLLTLDDAPTPPAR